MFNKFDYPAFIKPTTVPNDDIDIYAKKLPSITAKILKPSVPEELKVELEGKPIDYSVANAIRCTVMTSIPIYAFNRANTNIEVERCHYMYNNDLVYNQVETLPIYDIPNYFDLEDPETYLTTEVMKNIFSSFVREKYSSDTNETVPNDALQELDEDVEKRKLFDINITINVKNKSGEDRFVTTHDISLNVNGEVSDSYMKRDPLSILVLKPTEEFSMSATANLGIAAMHAAYEATTNAIHIELSPMKYQIIYETLGQLDKNIIFSKACVILTKKLVGLYKYIESRYPEDRPTTEIIEIDLFGADHTIGCLLATALQKCEFIEKAAYKMAHLFVNEITVAFKVWDDSKIGPIKCILDTITYLIKVFNQINKEFKAITK